MKRHYLLLVSALLSMPITAQSAGLPLYAGFSAGASSLRPDTENSAFELESSTSFGAGVFVGYDISKRFSLEASYHNLGKATLNSAGSESEIGYSALSAGALMYLLGDVNNIADRHGFMGYVRLGLSAMDNDTDIPLEKADNVALWVGAGAEWSFTNMLSLRGEVTSFDGDAQAVRLSVLFRPRSSFTRSNGPRPEARRQTSAPVTTPQVAPPVSSQQSAPKPPIQAPTIVQPDVRVAPPVTGTGNSVCVTPAANEPVDGQGCGLFSGPLRGVEFATGTATITPVGQQLLDRLVAKLQRYSTVAIEIQAHTESFGNAARAQEVARQRTLAVARYLANKGIPVSRLRARAFGHTQPIAADNSAGGQRRNNRIELRVLP